MTTSNDEHGDAVKPISALFVIGLAMPMILLKAWVLTYLWQWYIMPIFAAPPLRIVFAFGLSLTINYLMPITRNEPDMKNQNHYVLLWQLLLSPLLALLLGWIGTWFI